jgi:hypothetical protein
VRHAGHGGAGHQCALQVVLFPRIRVCSTVPVQMTVIDGPEGVYLFLCACVRAGRASAHVSLKIASHLTCWGAPQQQQQQKQQHCARKRGHRALNCWAQTLARACAASAHTSSCQARRHQSTPSFIFYFFMISPLLCDFRGAAERSIIFSPVSSPPLFFFFASLLLGAALTCSSMKATLGCGLDINARWREGRASGVAGATLLAGVLWLQVFCRMLMYADVC